MFKSLLPILAVSFALAAPMTVDAAEMTVKTADSNTDFGTAKLEDYDVAVHVADVGIIGKQLTEIQIPVKEDAAITSYSVFLTSTLKVASRKNVADIATYEVTPSDGKIVFKLDEPYTIPEGGVYVGYSITISELNDETEYPIKGSMTTNDFQFWVHSTRTYYKYLDKSDLGFTPCFIFKFEGDFYSSAASIALGDKVGGEYDKAVTVPATIANYGTDAINNVDIAYSYGSESGTVHVDLATPIEAVYGEAQNIEVTLPASDAHDTYDLTFEVTKVNGIDNKFDYRTASTSLVFYSFIPTHRPVMEEYTGCWCGYCPRGFAAMQYMNKHYPDFIGIAYHNGDPMDSNGISEPNSVSGYPYCYMDRTTGCDPYYASQNSFGIESDWLSRAAVVADADISVSAGFNSSNDNLIDVQSCLKFVKSHENANYRLAYVLTADDLYAIDGNTSAWVQSNYFAGSNASSYEIEEMAQFCNGSSSVYDLHYDDVALVNPDTKGIANSVPSTITEREAIVSDVYQVSIAKATSTYASTKNQSLIQNRDNLYIVALLLDYKTGYIVNAAKAHVEAAFTSVSNISADNADVVATEYFDLSGRKVANPAQGLYIKRMILSNGQVKAEKTIVK